MRLAERGAKVETVDIDPASLRAAADVFGFDPARVQAHQADARTFLRGCTEPYDVVLIDLFQGDGTPDYLVTADFFRDLKKCLGERGIAVFNTFADLDRPRIYAHLLATLRAELPYIVLYRPDYGIATHINSFIVASPRPLPSPVRADLDHVPARHLQTLPRMLQEPIPLDQQLLAEGRVITDARNPAGADFAEKQLINRRWVVESLPPAFFVN
jgi:spermidine synthase